VNSFLKEKEMNMLLLLERLVNIDSGSANKYGIDQVGSILQDAFTKLGFFVEPINEEVQGNHLVISHRESIEPEILIVAHMDTVFKEGTAKERPFKVLDGKAYGPGVVDMKGSLVSLLYAVQALVGNDAEGVKNIVILLTSDEEIGSITSRKLIEAHTLNKKYALIMEPARENGALVTARRGAGEYVMSVKGVAAHAGIAPEAGRSAIEELARKITKLHALSNPLTGISVNVGLIEGGSSANTVASSAVAHIDLRISKMEQAAWLEQQVKEICAVPDVEGTTIELVGAIDRPPMVKNDKTIKLLEVIQEVGLSLNINISDVSTGGGSDASFTSAQGVATIDGLGPVGGKAHTEEEYLVVSSLLERTELLANIIQRLTVLG